MTPDELDAVAVTWQVLARRRREVLDVIADHLPDSSRWPARERASWIVEAVDRWSSCLARPSCLDEVAASMVGRRPLRDSAALRTEGRALLVGLELSAPLAPDARTGWRRAWQLFAEVLAPLMLEPFGPRRPRGPSAT